jgi:alpha/beta hydrolase fold
MRSTARSPIVCRAVPVSPEVEVTEIWLVSTGTNILAGWAIEKALDAVSGRAKQWLKGKRRRKLKEDPDRKQRPPSAIIKNSAGEPERRIDVDSEGKVTEYRWVKIDNGYAEIGDARLHYVEAGDGPLILLLHGFPEFWYGWRQQIQPLAAAGFHVVAPDMRGYNLSSKPDGVAAYDTDKLAADIRGLISERGAESAHLVGHDWGGTAAWATAMNQPEVVDRLAILNAAHPRMGYRRDCTTRTSSASPGTSSSSLSRSCPKASCTPTAGISSGTSCTTPARRTHRRRWTATSRRGRSRARPPG